MNIKKYYIKISKNKYNCNKSSLNVVNDIIDIHIDMNNKYTICEEIKDNIKGQKIILIDELISTGDTIYHTMEYLKNVKKVSYVLPTTICLFEDRFRYDFYNICITKNKYIIWPWGYEN